MVGATVTVQCSSDSKCLSHIASCVAVATAIYSASMVDNATVVYRLEHHKIEAP